MLHAIMVFGGMTYKMECVEWYGGDRDGSGQDKRVEVSAGVVFYECTYAVVVASDGDGVRSVLWSA